MKKKYSKRYKKLAETSKEKKAISIEEAIEKVKTNCTTKFDESIDISFKLNLKQCLQLHSIDQLIIFKKRFCFFLLTF